MCLNTHYLQLDPALRQHREDRVVLLQLKSLGADATKVAVLLKIQNWNKNNDFMGNVFLARPFTRKKSVNANWRPTLTRARTSHT